VDEQTEKMLELLEKREDEHFEGFCQALEDTDQRGVVDRHLQKHRVCKYQCGGVNYGLHCQQSLYVLCIAILQGQWRYCDIHRAFSLSYCSAIFHMHRG